MTAPPRTTWAVGVLGLGPGRRVLEVGGGTAASAGLVLARIGGGHLISLDRSPTATARIAAGCADWIARGRLTVVTGTLGGLGEDVVASRSVDVAFAVDVNAFWTTDARAEVAALRRVLVPGGLVAVCFGADGPRADAVRARVLDPVAAHLVAGGLVDVDVRVEPEGVGVLARAPSA